MNVAVARFGFISNCRLSNGFTVSMACAMPTSPVSIATTRTKNG